MIDSEGSRLPRRVRMAASATGGCPAPYMLAGEAKLPWRYIGKREGSYADLT